MSLKRCLDFLNIKIRFKKNAPEPRAHVKFMMCSVYFGPGEVEVPLNPAQPLLLSNRF